MSSTKGLMGPEKARQLYLMLQGQIATGEIAAGARLPSEPALAATHSVSRVTVRRALDKLESEDVIQRVPGVGTFVKDRPISRPVQASLTDVLAHLADMGRNTELKLLSFSYGEAPKEVGDALHLGPDEVVQRAVRVRLVDGAPFSYLTTYVPERIGSGYSEADLATTPLLDLLERSGVVPERAEQTISAVLAAPEVAKHLEVEVGSALISVTRVIFTGSGEGVEHLYGLYRPDRYSLHLGLVRSDYGGRIWKTTE